MSHGKKTVYLANPYGFSSQQSRVLLPEIVHVLEEMGAEVWEPFSKNNQTGYPASGRAWSLGELDVRDVREADGFFGVVNGVPPDEGVMVELGIAIALNKPRFLFRDDFRRCTDSDDYPLNLMLFAGLGADNWRDHYYTHLDQLKDSNKALAKWLNAP